MAVAPDATFHSRMVVNKDHSAFARNPGRVWFPAVQDPAERRFILLWLISALIVTGLRFSSQIPISFDLGLQVQAAQNLLSGKGLSIYAVSAPDLAAPAILRTLTYFPAGYSLYAAVFFAIGGSVPLAMKVLAGTATLLGWWGWGLLAYPFFRDGLRQSGPWKWAGATIAVICPLLFTVDWAGTDVFLWAAVPWVVRWVVRASKENTPATARFDLLAGALCGVLVLIRYASVFLAVYAGLLILLQSRLRLYLLIRRWGAFALGLLPALGLQIYINYFLSKTAATPGSLSTSQLQLALIAHRVLDGLPLLKAVNYPWAFWFPGIAMKLLFPPANGGFPWQIAITLGIYAFLLLAARAYAVNLSEAWQDSRISTLGLFIVFPLLLWACMILANYDYLANARYYKPLLPLGVFVVYSVASLRSNEKRTGVARILQVFCAIYITGFVVLGVVYVALFFAPGERGEVERYRLFATEPGPWPAMGVAPAFSEARNFVVQLMRENPGAVLLTSSKRAWFAWDPALDQSKLHELSCGEALESDYLSGPVSVVILTFDDGEPGDLWADTRNLAGKLEIDDNQRSSLAHVPCFEVLPGLRLRQRFPKEGLKVLEAQVPAGMQFALRR